MGDYTFGFVLLLSYFPAAWLFVLVRKLLSMSPEKLSAKEITENETAFDASMKRLWTVGVFGVFVAILLTWVFGLPDEYAVFGWAVAIAVCSIQAAWFSTGTH